jgi:Ca2+-binding EF-hand superfamily protein
VKLDEIQLGILVFMINVIIKQDNQVGLMKVFNRIDTKEDGEIDEAEIKSALMSYLDLSSKKAEQQTKEFMKKIDIDASGFINYTGKQRDIQSFSSQPATYGRY